MGRQEKAGLCGKVMASGLAGLVAAFVGSEMLQGVTKAKNDRSLLGLMCMANFFGLWACWEMLQVRQHLNLADEIGTE